MTSLFDQVYNGSRTGPRERQMREEMERQAAEAAATARRLVQDQSVPGSLVQDRLIPGSLVTTPGTMAPPTSLTPGVAPPPLTSYELQPRPTRSDPLGQLQPSRQRDSDRAFRSILTASLEDGAISQARHDAILSIWGDGAAPFTFSDKVGRPRDLRDDDVRADLRRTAKPFVPKRQFAVDNDEIMTLAFSVEPLLDAYESMLDMVMACVVVSPCHITTPEICTERMLGGFFCDHQIAVIGRRLILQLDIPPASYPRRLHPDCTSCNGPRWAAWLELGRLPSAAREWGAVTLGQLQESFTKGMQELQANQRNQLVGQVDGRALTTRNGELIARPLAWTEGFPGNGQAAGIVSIFTEERGDFWMERLYNRTLESLDDPLSALPDRFEPALPARTTIGPNGGRITRVTLERGPDKTWAIRIEETPPSEMATETS